MPNEDVQRYSFEDETADVTVRREIIRFYGPALGRATMGTLVYFKDLALRHRENDPRCENDEFSLSYSELINFVGCSREALANDIRKMTELGLLSKITEKTKKNDKKWNESNRYRILLPDFTPSQELVRKYWPSWWIPPAVKAFKIGSSEIEPKNRTTAPSSSKNELRSSSSETELRKTSGGSETELPTSSVVRLPNGNVVVVNPKETTTPDFVAVLLIEEIRRAQKFYPDFNAKTMVRYWSKSLERTFRDPGATLDTARERIRAVLEVAEHLKKRPDNFLVWFMAGVRDGYVHNPAAGKSKGDLKAGLEAAGRRKAEKEKFEKDYQRDWEKRMTAKVEEMVAWFESQPLGIGKEAAIRIARTRFEMNPLWPEALKLIRKHGVA